MQQHLEVSLMDLAISGLGRQVKPTKADERLWLLANLEPIRAFLDAESAVGRFIEC